MKRSVLNQLLGGFIVLAAGMILADQPMPPATNSPPAFPHPERIRYDNRSLIIDGQPIFIHSGAMHYFRCPRELWKRRLLQLKNAGLNCVETYLAWNLHEPEEPADPNDFSKLQEMDQIGDFIQTAQDVGLYVIIRPGPYICAEVDRGGLPGWLMNHQPQGLPPGHFLRGNSPAMLAWERHWLTAAARVVKPHLVTNLPAGSPGVILWQLENEYDWTFAGISSEVRTDVLRTLAQASLDHGIDVPLFTCETTDPAFRNDPLLRSHVFNTTNKYPGFDMKPLVDAIESVARYQPEAFRGVTELQGGWFSEAGGILSENMGHNAAQISQLALTAVEHGCTFINYYMFYGGSNFGTIASQRLTQSYDYNAPLREWGEEGSRFHAVQSVGEFLKDHGSRLIQSDPVQLSIEGEHPDVSITLRQSADGSRYFFIRNAKQHEERSGSVKVRTNDQDPNELNYKLREFEAKVLYVPAKMLRIFDGEWLPRPIQDTQDVPSAGAMVAPVRIVSITAEEPTPQWRRIHSREPLNTAGVFDQRYVHYKADFSVSAEEVSSGNALCIRSSGGAFVARVNAMEVAANDDRIQLARVAHEGANTVEILFENFGCPRFGPAVEETQGITEIRVVPSSVSSTSLKRWSMKTIAGDDAVVPEVAGDYDDHDWKRVTSGDPEANGRKGSRVVYRSSFDLSKNAMAAGVAMELSKFRGNGTLYINGQEASPLSPGLRSTVADVTRLSHEGRNSVALVLQSDHEDVSVPERCDIAPLGRLLTDVHLSAGTTLGAPIQDKNVHRGMLVHYQMQFELPDATSQAVPRKLHLQASANAFITLNGHLMGRYWAEGPQRDFWLPDCWLNFGPGTTNTVELQARPTPETPVGNVIRLAEVRSYEQPAGANASSSPGNIQLSPDDSVDDVIAKAASVTPTARQISWQRDEISAFIHFGMNTFTDREWGDGREDPKLFNPADLDARQWVKAAKAAGISRMILTAKHHDGFCLWPSQFTEHSVKNSPWKNGKGDVVMEFVDACRAEGMHYGIYISPWDRHEPSYGDSPRYNQHFLDQLREVFTTYPGIEEVWSDGACAEGPNGKKQEYDWRAYWKLIRELAPDAAISVRGPDVRWCGNEAGHTRRSEWSVLPMPGDDQSWETSDKTLLGFIRDIYGDDLGSREALMRSRGEKAALLWFPSQVNTSIRPGWFYHKQEDDRVRSLADLLNVYYGSVGGNGQFLLNIPPDRRGLFHENDVARLREFGDVLRTTFTQDLASGGKANAEVTGGSSIGKASLLVDGNPDTFWTTTDSPAAASVTVELPAPVRANCLMLQEHIASGQRVEAFEVDTFSDGQWQPTARGTVIGYKRLVRFPDATVSKVRIRLTQFRVRPTLSNVGLFFAPAVLSGPRITRDIHGIVTLEPPPGACARYTLDGSDPTEQSALYTESFALPGGGIITTQSFPLTPGRNDSIKVPGARTRLEYGPAKARWKVIDCSSEEAEGKASGAIDDNPQTLWHTRYRDGADPMPHHLSIDLGESMTIFGFAYMPRQDQWDNGIIMRARFEVSRDGKSWTVVADNLDFDNIVNSRQQQIIRLPTSVSARYFRMTALRTVHDNNVASAADVSVLVR